MSMIFRHIVFLFALFPLLPSAGQQLNRFVNYDVESGLAQSTVYAVMQDSRGFIWAGTRKGLNQFNGTHFTTFGKTRKGESSLLGNIVQAVYEDSDGLIWVGTQKGLNRYDPRLQQITAFEAYGVCDQCLLHRDIVAFLEVGEYLYIGSVGGLSRIHRKDGTITSYPEQDDNPNGPRRYAIRQLETTPAGEILIVSQVGIGIFDPKTEGFRHIDTSHGLRENKVQSLFKDSQGRFWLGYESQGFSLLTGTWQAPAFQHYAPTPPGVATHGFIYDFEEDAAGTLWLATFSGLALFDPKTEQFRYVLHDPENPASIPSNQIFDIHKDRDGRMWMGTLSGISVYDPYLNQFSFLSNQKNDPQSLAANNTFSIFRDSRGFTWVGNYNNGLTVIDPKGQAFHRIGQGKGPALLSGSQVLGFTETDEGIVYCATFNGINKIEWPDRSSYHYTISTLSYPPLLHNDRLRQYVYFVQRGRDNTLWAGTHGAGLLAFQTDGTVRQYVNDSRPDGITENAVLCASEDERGRIWMGNSVYGLLVLNNPKTDSTYTRLSLPQKEQISSVHEIEFVGPQKMLVSSGEGLYVFEDKEQLIVGDSVVFQVITEEEGLSDNVVYAIEQTDPNTFWLSTGGGLSKLQLDPLDVRSYTKIVDKAFYDYNQNASMFTQDGTLWFGGTHGVVYFDPEVLTANQSPPVLFFDDFRILNRPVPIGEAAKSGSKTYLREDIAYTHAVQLLPGDKIFSIALNAVNYSFPEEVSYAYKLEGFDTDWTYTREPLITRSNLDPGRYTLWAKAANNDKLWGEPISLVIEVLPPWYRTWWGYAIFGGLGIGLMWVLLRLRLQQERRLERARVQERDLFRKRSSRDFHDEAGTRITRITLITELARIENAGNADLQEYLRQIDENVQDLNNGMRDFIWTLDPTQDNAYDTLLRFTEFAGKLCEYAGILFKSAHIPESLKQNGLNMRERRHVLLILKEALNNSIKHGKPSRVQFAVKGQPDLLELSLHDNGTGFDPSTNPKGNGLGNMQERAKALGGTLELTSEVHLGTTLKLRLQTTHLGN